MMHCCGSHQCSVVELGLEKLFWSVSPTSPNMLLRKLLMFSFLILVTSERIEIEIKMDRRLSSTCAFANENEIGWCEHEISGHEMGQHKIESDTSSESTRVKFADDHRP